MSGRQAARNLGRVLLLAVFSLLCAVSAQAGGATDLLCAEQVRASEASYGIPPGLLESISIVESGRYDSQRRATIAWPWTVMAQGQGRYFPTKAEAIAEVRRLKAQGVENIDVGCMQVNLHFHPTAFANLEEAFDPAANVAYAARFLIGLYQATNHWPTAASYYHSQTPSRAASYREKLMRVWAALSGGEESTRLANAGPPRLPPGVAQRPRLAQAERPAERQRDLDANRAEEARIAAAYRVARIAEYQLRRAHFQEIRATQLARR